MTPKLNNHVLWTLLGVAACSHSKGNELQVAATRLDMKKRLRTAVGRLPVKMRARPASNIGVGTRVRPKADLLYDDVSEKVYWADHAGKQELIRDWRESYLQSSRSKGILNDFEENEISTKLIFSNFRSKISRYGKIPNAKKVWLQRDFPNAKKVEGDGTSFKNETAFNNQHESGLGTIWRVWEGEYFIHWDDLNDWQFTDDEPTGMIEEVTDVPDPRESVVAVDSLKHFYTVVPSQVCNAALSDAI